MKNTILILFFGLVGGAVLMFGAIKLYSSIHGAAISDAESIITNQLTDVEPIVVTIPSIGKLELKSPQQDSSNVYGAGDCNGLITQYTDHNRTFAFDTLDCGEYAITNSTYILENGLIKVVFIQTSSTNLTLELADRTYTLTENVYDFRKPPFLIHQRSGIYKQPNFELIIANFEPTQLEDPLTTFEHWENLYLGTWSMEEEY